MQKKSRDKMVQDKNNSYGLLIAERIRWYLHWLADIHAGLFPKLITVCFVKGDLYFLNLKSKPTLNLLSATRQNEEEPWSHMCKCIEYFQLLTLNPCGAIVT